MLAPFNSVLKWLGLDYEDRAFAKSDLDGHFGRDTAAATRHWQRQRGLLPTGSADRRAWAKAWERVENANVGGGGASNFHYHGDAHHLWLSKDTEQPGKGRWSYFFSGNQAVVASYETDTMKSQCEGDPEPL